MKSAVKVEVKTDAKARQRESAATEIDVIVTQRLVAAYDLYVGTGKRAAWELSDKLTNDPNERNVVHAINLMKLGLARRNGLEWKGKTLDPEYTNYASFCSKLVKVLTHPEYPLYRKSGMSIYQAYAEIMDKEKSRKTNINMEKMEKRATKFNSYVNQKMEHRKELAKKKKETQGWSAPQEDADKAWRKETWEIMVGEPRLFNRYMAHLARKRPDEFTAMLRYVVESGALPENVEITIE